MMILSALAIQAACLAVPGVGPQPVNSVTPAPSLTPTIVWFPPTDTPQPTDTPPTTTPTQEQKPGVGEILLRDEFTQPAAWLLGRFDGGSIALGLNEITLATSSPEALLVTFRQEPTLTNFYAEITIRPNLCEGRDAYGLAYRAASFTDYYAFLLSCDGQVQLVRNKLSEHIPLKDWTPAVGAVTPGIGGVIRLGVWAFGKEMRFFINGAYQFSVIDPTFSRGQIGITVQAAGQNALTANFSELEVRAVGGVIPPNPGTPGPAGQ